MIKRCWEGSCGFGSEEATGCCDQTRHQTAVKAATVATANPEVPYFTALRWQPAVGQETVHTGCMEAACFSRRPWAASEQISGGTDVLGARVFVTTGVHAVRVTSAAPRPVHPREGTVYFSSCLESQRSVSWSCFSSSATWVLGTQTWSSAVCRRSLYPLSHLTDPVNISERWPLLFWIEGHLAAVSPWHCLAHSGLHGRELSLLKAAKGP